MKYIEVVASSGSAGTVEAIAEKAKAQDFRLGPVNPQDESCDVDWARV